MATKPASKWIYERGEGRNKHCWNQPRAGFVPGLRGQVGKCSNQITDAVATELIYVAVPTQPGKSYHGYPVRGPLPRKLLKKLRQKAEETGCLKAFEKWVRDYIK